MKQSNLSDSSIVVWQKAEGLAVWVAASVLFFAFDGTWYFYLIFILFFDLFMLGYLLNNSVGAFVYNLGHSLILPITLMMLGLAIDNNLILQIASLWAAHIGMDRVFGYGLKSKKGFRYTSLGVLKKENKK